MFVSYGITDQDDKEGNDFIGRVHDTHSEDLLHGVGHFGSKLVTNDWDTHGYTCKGYKYDN